MSDLLLLTAGILGLAIVISLAMALMIKAIVVALPLLQRRAGPESRAAEPEARTATAAPVPAEHVAAIASAVAATIGAHHIIHIEDRSRGAVWTAEGRMLHQTSHSIARSPKR